MSKIRGIVLLSILMLSGCSSDDVSLAASNELNDIPVLWDTINLIDQSQDIDIKAIANLGTLITRKVLIVRSLGPQVDELNGHGLEGLCAAILFSESPQLKKANSDPALANMAREYLSKVKPDLVKKVTELKKTIWTSEKCPI